METTTRTGRPAALGRLLQSNLRRMKRLYRDALAAPQKSPAALWLCDNFYVLEKEAKQTARDLKNCPPLPLAGGVPRLYLLCLAGLEQRPLLCQQLAEQLAERAQGAHDLTVAEFGFFPLALRAALLQMACAACAGAGDERQISYAVTCLTKLSAIDFDALVSRYSVVEAILLRDPAGIYPQMEKESRGSYRALLGQIAGKTGKTERAVAEEFLNRAKAGKTGNSRHVGQYIVHSPLLWRENRWRRGLALAGAPIVALALAGAAGWWANSLAAALLAFLPLWEFVRPALERAALAGVRVRHIPRMKKECAEEVARQTVVAVSALVPRPENAPAAARRLEQLYFSNASEDFTFCLLADFKENGQPVCPEDEPQLKALKSEIERLNAAHGNRFLLFVRGRVYNQTQGRYAGWERKRGAITELIRCAKGDITTVRLFVGDKSRLERMHWLLALDGDTNLPFDTAGRMTAAAAHPLNRAVMDEQRGVVTSGYGIFVPRMATTLESRNKTAFSRVMAGEGGVTTYDEATGDLYQDLFHEAIFAGKGLLDTDCFYRLLNTRFPEGCVLSHDVLEGAYLRAAYLSDVELTDSFPSTAAAWFSRLGRWARGDWQNSAFLFCRSPINALSRFKLFDNLRRTLTPVLTFACVLAALFLPARAAVALFWAALLAVCGAPLAAAAQGVAAGGMPVFSRKFFTLALPPALEQLARAGLSLVLLPKTALVCLRAIWLALYRRFFSHKNLLEWVTAAETEGKSGAVLRQYAFAELLGLAVLFFTPHPLLHFYGLVFSAALPLAAFTGRQRPGSGPALTADDREQLTGYCAAMWRFFERYAGADEHFLPPDNIQQSPVYAVARRTSPTNIGLLLLSALTARDLLFITPDELCERVAQTIATVERLEKWRGNLYNWYDTSNLALLEPRFVSSVDSGNFVCCLVALKEGLREQSAVCPQAEPLAARVEALIAATDLAAFYDERRELLSIGYNVSQSEMMDSYYDFFMSEARMAGYYAVASRQVPKRHWGVLSRAMSRQGAYAGPVSWTGTMFEYFMPHLLLPVYEGSLLCEALDYCLYCQRRRVRDEKTPWGISESAFYRFDSRLNYQYKAHGVQKLGVKRGLNDELVISPYSTFLTLQFAPVAAMKNLRRMEQLGFCGGYGFFEAIDYTQSRVHAQCGVCRSFMAHHLGMSLVAAGNALFEGRMQQRFLRDSHMNAAKDLLQEKLCRDAVFYDNVRFKDFKEREAVKTVLSEEYDHISPQSPQAILLSNGALTDALTDTGAGWLSFAGRCLTRRPDDLLAHPAGVYAFLQAGDDCFSLTAAPLYQPHVRYRAEFLANGVIYRAKLHSLQTGIRVLLHPTLPCEQREYQIKNLSRQPVKAALLCYCEPTLAAHADHAAHPAFSKLFVTAEYDAGARVLVFTRREREGGRQDYFAVGFLEDVAVEYEAQRENLMNAPNGYADLLGFAARPFTGGAGTPDAACALRLTLELPANGRGRVTQLFAAGQTRDEAVAAIAALRGQGRMPPETAPANPLLDDTMEGRLAFALLPRLLFAGRESRENDTARAQNTLGTPALWALAISGDRPIVLFPAEGGFDNEHAACYLSLYKKCRLNGIAFDLVFTVPEFAPPALEECVQLLGCADELGAGVYFIRLSQHSEQTRTLLWAAAVHIAPKSGARVAPPSRPFLPAEFTPLRPAPLGDEAVSGLAVAGGVFAEGRFFVGRKTAGLPFSHILANPTFGTLVGDTSLGFTWAVNARENKLTPWRNDIATGNLGERLLLRRGERFYDLVNGARASFAQTDARYEGMAEDICSRTVVTVPAKGCAKTIAVTLTNQSDAEQCVTLAYYTEPVLGVERSGARQISAAFTDGCLICRNPFQTAVRGVSALACDARDYYAVCDRAEFLCGRWEQGGGRVGAELCAALLAPVVLPPRQGVTVTFRLVWAANPQAAAKLAHLPLRAYAPVAAVRLHTPDRALDEMINHFVPHQILQCRVWGRTAFYQCGGAFGFRDQLQDVTACLLFAPQTAKVQILRAAAAQFPQGDVLHWWHRLPQSGGGLRGVRTKYSDDLLWLPFAVCEYVAHTGDEGILNTVVPFIQGDPLGKDETERYFDVARSDETATVREHCIRAIEHAHRLGAHGLPLIGCGDWNDGFNTVGGGGAGESVWLAMFLALVLERFAPLLRLANDNTRADEYWSRAAALKAAVDKHAWDGKWYLRAFYDDGTPMGTAGADECAIDLLPQSFAVLCGMPDKTRVAQALESALEHLAVPELRVIKLFDKPFVNGAQQPGYIKAYPAGVRENGGQYTHAGVWMALAMLRQGKADEGLRLLSWINPAERALEPSLAERYKLEPYYIPADIYTSENAPGRGGWSLYTGAASWYYKAVTEALLGICVRGKKLSLSPCIPAGWQGFALELDLCGTLIAVTAKRGNAPALLVNGAPCDDIPLDGAQKKVEVTFV